MATFTPTPLLPAGPSIPALVPTIVGGAWAAALAMFGLQRLDRLGLPAFDNAYFQQLAWGIFHGHVFHASFLQGNFLGLHFSPILVLPALVELALPGFSTLNLLSALALGAVAPAAFLACRAILPRTVAGTWVAILVAVVLPFTPPLQEAAWAGFHPEELALPAILLATWAAFSGRWRLMALLVAVVLLAKEDQGYAVGILGLVLYRVGPPRRTGLWLMAAALGWTVMVVLVVMPLLRHGLATDTTGYYSWLVAGGPRALVSPGRTAAIASAVLSPDAWRSVGLTVFALCLLPLLRPGFAVLALPPLLAATLSRHQPQPHLQLQYALPVIYPLLIAAALGGRRALQFRAQRSVLVTAALVPGIAVALSGSLLIPLARDITRPGPGALSSVNRAVQLVPGDAELDADDSVATAAASRANLHLLPRAVPGSYVLVDTAARPPQYAEAAARDRVVGRLHVNRRVLWTDGRLQLWSPEWRESGQATRVALPT